jgi:lambda family phage tail tape measure protein
MSDIIITGDSSNAVRAIDRVQREMQTLQTTFSNFRNVLGTLALGNFIQQAFNSASAINSLSRSTNIAADTIKGFADAVSASGGNTGQANDAISDLVKNLGDAANGSTELVKAFAQAGVSLTDLRTLSEEDILKKTVDGIARMGDAAVQSSTKAKIFGEALKTVSLNNVSATLQSSIDAAQGYGKTSEAAAETQRKLTVAVDKLGEALLKISTPLLDLINKIDLTSSAASKLFEVIGEAVKWAAYAAAVVLVVKALGLLVSLALTVKSVLAGLGIGLTALINLLRSPLTRSNLIKNLEELSDPSLANKVKTIFEGLGGSVAFVKNNWEKLTLAIGAATGALLKYLNIDTSKIFGGSAGADNEALVDRLQKESMGTHAESSKGTLDTLRRGQDALAQQQAILQRQAASYSLMNSEHTRFTKNLELSMGFQTGLVGLTEQQVELQNNLRQETERYQGAVDALKDKQQQLRNNMIGEEDTNKLQTYGAEIGLINTTLSLMERQHLKNRDIIERQTNAIQSARTIEQARLKDIENTTKALEDQFARQQQLNDILSGVGQQRLAVGRGGTAGDTAGLTGIQKQVREIAMAAEEAARSASAAFASQFDSEDGLTPERAQELADGLNQINTAYLNLAGAQADFAIKNYESARSFDTGWNEAFARFKDNVTNVADQASNYFDKLTNGVADSFAKMAESGKWSFSDLKESFKSLANSMIADFIRIQVKRAILGSITGGGSFLGSLFGKANGGSVAGGVPITVGERGPELFVPRTAGTIVPNNGFMGGSAAQAAQPTQVTYNIQAVDASSFRSLVARDPSFLYAVTEKGRQSQPRARLA